MKIFTGKVISKNNQKTAKVAVERMIVHKIYGKRVKSIKKYQVHDELNSVIGDMVQFTDSKPISKTKKWKIISIVYSKAKSKNKNNKKLIKKIKK